MPIADTGAAGATGVVQIPRSGVVPAGPRPLDPAPAPDDRINSESSTNVRSNFPETWIWTDATTGCVVHIRVVFRCYTPCLKKQDT